MWVAFTGCRIKIFCVLCRNNGESRNFEKGGGIQCIFCFYFANFIQFPIELSFCCIVIWLVGHCCNRQPSLIIIVIISDSLPFIANVNNELRHIPFIREKAAYWKNSEPLGMAAPTAPPLWIRYCAEIMFTLLFLSACQPDFARWSQLIDKTYRVFLFFFRFAASIVRSYRHGEYKSHKWDAMSNIGRQQHYIERRSSRTQLPGHYFRATMQHDNNKRCRHR